MKAKELELFLGKGFDTDQTGLIAKITDKSDGRMTRSLIEFKNGLALSIIRGPYSYGGNKGLFEIGPFNKSGYLDGSLLDDEDQVDDVCGYCSPEKVSHYIQKIGAIEGSK